MEKPLTSRQGELQSASIRVSIITPVMNGESFIERCILSILNSSGLDVEHIVVDGGSTDRTVDIVQSLSLTYSGLRLVIKAGCSQSAAMNIGLNLASGDIICFLNADDWLTAGSLQRSLALLDSDPCIHFVVGALENISLNGPSWISQPSIKLSDLLLYDRYRWPLNPACYIFRKSLQDQIGPYPEDENLVMDYWFLLRAKLYGNWSSLTAVQGIFFRHESNKSFLASDVDAQLLRTRQDFLAHLAPLPWRIYVLLLDLWWYIAKPLYRTVMIRNLYTLVRAYFRSR